MEREILLSKNEVRNNYTPVPKPGTYKVRASGTANVIFDSNLGLDVQLINFKAVPGGLFSTLKQAFADRGDGYINLLEFGRGRKYPNFSLVYRNILNNGDDDKIRKPLKNELCQIQVDYARDKEGNLVTDENDNAIMNIIDFTFISEANNRIGMDIDDAPHPAETERSEELTQTSKAESEAEEAEEAPF